MSSQDPVRSMRVRVYLSNAELAAIEEFRSDEQLPTTADALRELMRRGLVSSSSVLPNKPH